MDDLVLQLAFARSCIFQLELAVMIYLWTPVIMALVIWALASAAAHCWEPGDEEYF